MAPINELKEESQGDSQVPPRKCCLGAVKKLSLTCLYEVASDEMPRRKLAINRLFFKTDILSDRAARVEVTSLGWVDRAGDIAL